MKLIKINAEHYIICDDSEIKEGDWVLTQEKTIHQVDYVDAYTKINDWKKITHSTQPFEDAGISTSVGYIPVYDKIAPISLLEVKELIGMVDVEKKKQEYLQKVKEDIKNKPQDIRIGILGGSDFGFIEGYNQAVEDNMDKVYTEVNVIVVRNKLVDMLPTGNVTSWDMIQAVANYTRWFDEYIQSLQPKTEWEVEFVNNKLKLI